MGAIMIAMIALPVLSAAGCMVLAWLTDHEAAGATGCIEEGQVW